MNLSGHILGNIARKKHIPDIYPVSKNNRPFSRFDCEYRSKKNTRNIGNPMDKITSKATTGLENRTTLICSGGGCCGRFSSLEISVFMR